MIKVKPRNHVGGASAKHTVFSDPGSLKNRLRSWSSALYVRKNLDLGGALQGPLPRPPLGREGSRGWHGVGRLQYGSQQRAASGLGCGSQNAVIVQLWNEWTPRSNVMVVKTVLRLWCTSREGGYLSTSSTKGSGSHLRATRCCKIRSQMDKVQRDRLE